MLPANHQPSHDAAVVARQHVEYLDPPVMSQALSKARLALLFTRRLYSEPVQSFSGDMLCSVLVYPALFCPITTCLDG